MNANIVRGKTLYNILLCLWKPMMLVNWESMFIKNICLCYRCIPSHKLYMVYKRHVQSALSCSLLFLSPSTVYHGVGCHIDHHWIYYVTSSFILFSIKPILTHYKSTWTWMMTTAHERDSTSQLWCMGSASY